MVTFLHALAETWMGSGERQLAVSVSALDHLAIRAAPI